VIAIRKKLRMLGANERGATAIEYGLIAALICVAAIGAMSQLGGGTNGMWTQISADVTAAMQPPSA
jgi:pilus assembly protein Flp/PilA